MIARATRAELVETLLKLRGAQHVSMVVDGESMTPTIRPGDAIWLEKTTADFVTPGDVVLIARVSDVVVHRLLRFVEKDRRRVALTKGDGAIATEHVDPRWIVARVVRVERDGCALPMPCADRLLVLRPWVQRLYVRMEIWTSTRSAVLRHLATALLVTLTAVCRLQIKRGAAV